MTDDAQQPYELVKTYDPQAIEEKWARFWVEEHLFDTPEDASAKPFTMLLPPPNVTGRLHMGHMLNQTEMDILTRWHRMRGERALWIPGTDHASIATHMMVERQLASENLTRHQIGREAFLDRAWAWKQRQGGAITTQMRRLGASVDWSREYFTLDPGLSAAVVEAFVRLHEQGLIYRGTYIVNWDPIAQTAVSDLEVDSEERVGKLYQIRYPRADGEGSITIATTRPETLLGDVAVAVNPKDARYQALIGKLLKLPLTGRQIPIVADDWANPEFGTGAVKVTPAHDPNDYAIGQRHSLPSLSILDKSAHIDLPLSALGDNEEGNAAKLRYQGLDRFEARTKILGDLEALGLLVAVKDHAMAVPVSQRTGAVIEPRLSEQWFLKIKPLAEKATAAVREGHIRFTPEMYAKTYFEWMENIYDWCLSRQLWWGHRIPAWYCDRCHAVTVARTAPTTCATCGHGSLTQDSDALDTWFSSGLLPFTVFGWPAGSTSPAEDQPTPDMAAFYPTDLLVTGFDILFFWVARMIMLSTHFMLDVPMPDGSPRALADAVPFRKVYIHALVRDANREKMSKTKGNVIDPIDIIGRFGTDAVRFTLASMASPGTDIAFSEARTEGYRAFANKIWNAARFVFMNMERASEAGILVNFEKLPESLKPIRNWSSNPNSPHLDHLPTIELPTYPLESRFIISRLSQTADRVQKSLSEYRFDEAASHIYQFFWGDFCDWYLELVKLRCNFTDDFARQAASHSIHVLVSVFEAALRLLSPFMPFITDELWHALYKGRTPAKSIALTRYPTSEDYPAEDLDSNIREMNSVQALVVAIRAIRKEMGILEKERTPVNLFLRERFRENQYDLFPVLVKSSEINYSGVPLSGIGTRSTAAFDVQVIYERQIDVPAERERLTKDLAKFEKGLLAGEKQLNNEAFTAKAPAHIVEGLRKQAAETRALYDKTRSALAALPPA